MDERRRNRLQEAGVDVDDALERMMGSEALLERLLGKFLEDENYQKLCTALDEKRQEDAVAASHTLKGCVRKSLHAGAVFPLYPPGGGPACRRLDGRRGADGRDPARLCAGAGSHFGL